MEFKLKTKVSFFVCLLISASSLFVYGDEKIQAFGNWTVYKSSNSTTYSEYAVSNPEEKTDQENGSYMIIAKIKSTLEYQISINVGGSENLDENHAVDVVVESSRAGVETRKHAMYHNSAQTAWCIDQKENDKLLNDMKSMKSLSVSFKTKSGQQKTVKYSLDGISSALKAMSGAKK